MAKGKKKKSDKWAKLNTFVDVTMKGLKPAEVRVWLVLFRDLKPEGLARTGQADLARRCGLCLRSVGEAVKGLVDKGLVRVVRRGRLNGGPSIYQLRGHNPEGAATTCERVIGGQAASGEYATTQGPDPSARAAVTPPPSRHDLQPESGLDK